MARKKTDRKEVHVSIRITPEVHSKAVAASDKDSRSLNWYIGKAIEEKVARDFAAKAVS